MPSLDSLKAAVQTRKSSEISNALTEYLSSLGECIVDRARAKVKRLLAAVKSKLRRARIRLLVTMQPPPKTDADSTDLSEDVDDVDEPLGGGAPAEAVVDGDSVSGNSPEKEAATEAEVM